MKDLIHPPRNKTMKTATKLCVALAALMVATSGLRAAVTVTTDPANPYQ